MCNPISDPVGCAKDVATAPFKVPGQLIGGAAEKAAESGFDAVVGAFTDGANWAVKELMALWLGVPSPDVSGDASVVTWIDARLHYIVIVVMLGTVVWSCARLAFYADKADARNLGEMVLRTVIVGGGAATIVSALLVASDAWAGWIIDQSDIDMSKAVLSGTIAPGVLLLLAFIVVVSQLIQVLIMIARGAMVAILTGTITLAAASSGTQMGRSWFQKQISWLLAFILYKPVAALIYAVSFQLTTSEKMIEQLQGVLVMLLAIFALPALMRLIVPATAAVGGANAGALAGVAVGAAVAAGVGAAGAAAGGSSAGFSGAGQAGAGKSAGGLGGGDGQPSGSKPPSPGATSGPTPGGASGGDETPSKTDAVGGGEGSPAAGTAAGGSASSANGSGVPTGPKPSRDGGGTEASQPVVSSPGGAPSRGATPPGSPGGMRGTSSSGNPRRPVTGSGQVAKGANRVAKDSGRAAADEARRQDLLGDDQ